MDFMVRPPRDSNEERPQWRPLSLASY